jgi:ornithine carbamoyltransferase
VNLKGRNFLKEVDFTKEEFLSLIDLARELREEKLARTERRRLSGRNIALIFEKASTRTLSAFEVGASDQGAHVTYLGPQESHIGYKETMKDTARVLGRMFDGIEYRGFSQDTVEELGKFAGVPVWNGLTDQWHPTQMLADVLTVGDHLSKPLEEVALCYLGDASNNTANSLLVTGALLGMDVRIVGPEDLLPTPPVRRIADKLAEGSAARLSIGSDIGSAVRGADVLYTDVWVSMGDEAQERERTEAFRGYRIDAELLTLAKPDAHVMHDLPAHRGLEITDEVMDGPRSIVWDQAEDRLHAQKAILELLIGPRT